MAITSARVPNRILPTRIDSSLVYGRVVPLLGLAAFATSRLFGSGNALTGALVTALWLTAATGWLFCRCPQGRSARRAHRGESYAEHRTDRGESYAERRGGVVLGQPADPKPQDVLPGERGQARMPH